MHNNVYNGRHRLCSVTDILLKTRSVGICQDMKPALCEFEPFEPDKRKTSNVRSCSDTSSSTSFSTTQTSLQHLLNVGKGVSESSAVTRDHNSEERLKRRVIALEQNQTTDLSKVISKTNRTDHKTSETYLNYSINDMKSNNISNNSDANFHISFSNSTEVNKYENNSTIPSGVTPNTVHVVIGILGIIVFVILICGLFINDLKSMTLHIVRGEEGRANRENHALYHPRLTVHANYQNELSSTQTLSQSRDRLSFKD
ncbi:putative uncharacterized protein DDB_G0289041 [Argopecten irradians]|uniref:putative uncharacterized protein DDB_G0289041 n=1 Tax=Argopecten irradians TaxID=31199 RepID=UPI003713CC7D